MAQVDTNKEATQKDHNTTPRASQDGEKSAEAPQPPEATTQPSSPLLTTHRLSKSSLTERKAAAEAAGDAQSQASKSRSNSMEQGDATPKPPPKTSRFGNFSASLPSVPWGSTTGRRPSSNNRDPSPQPPMPPAPRRNTPFGWLSRATSTNNPKSPPLPAKPASDIRRNTAASISTIGSNPDLTLKALDEGQDSKTSSRAPARQSLRDRFKLLRMQEEVGVTNLDDPEQAEEDFGGITVVSPASAEEKELPLPPKSPLPQSPIQDPSATINPNLAAGTVSGISASARDVTTPIDWDFWQTVVNEGPQAVARTSPEELTAAIAGGIPQTIRGVIWQVLASSKNEDLEEIYQQLKLKGTKDETKDTPSLVSSTTVNGSVKEKESIASSKSSIVSEDSTPATSTNVAINSPTSSSQDHSDPIANVKVQTELATERAKRAKADSAALIKLEKMIKKDMGARTSYSKYTAAAGLQDGLFNVCRAYALFDDAVGYPQGMNFIIMPMLFIMPEEEAFCLLVRLMNKYQLRELFVHDMPGLHLHLYQFERLLEDLEPTLYCHLNRRGVTPKLYATPWFLTLFAYRFPLQLVMRVFDLVLCEGLEGAILKFGMALVQRNAQMLLAMDDMQALTNYLKEKLFDVYIDSAPSSKSLLESGFFGSSGGTESEVYRADILVQDACAVRLTPEMLGRYTTEYEERTRAEKARETELENLRTDTATKAARIRSLEQRAEKSDAEHIEIANELVKLKVENQDLLDENESLKGQVEELKKVAASEATNVEERMRAGTEQVMQRNIEVQNENRHMEEQMAEMERELVEMKMKYAEVRSSSVRRTRESGLTMHHS